MKYRFGNIEYSDKSVSPQPTAPRYGPEDSPEFESNTLYIPKNPHAGDGHMIEDEDAIQIDKDDKEVDEDVMETSSAPCESGGHDAVCLMLQMTSLKCLTKT